VELLNKTLVSLFFPGFMPEHWYTYIITAASILKRFMQIEVPSSDTPLPSSEEIWKPFLTSYWNNSLEAEYTVV